VTHRHLCRRQQQVGGVIREHPVVLLRHPSVERPETGLQVRHPQMDFDGGDGGGEG
jgi:hypothetical protein